MKTTNKKKSKATEEDKRLWQEMLDTGGNYDNLKMIDFAQKTKSKIICPTCGDDMTFNYDLDKILDHHNSCIGYFDFSPQK